MLKILAPILIAHQAEAGEPTEVPRHLARAVHQTSEDVRYQVSATCLARVKNSGPPKVHTNGLGEWTVVENIAVPEQRCAETALKIYAEQNKDFHPGVQIDPPDINGTIQIRINGKDEEGLWREAELDLRRLTEPLGVQMTLEEKGLRSRNRLITFQKGNKIVQMHVILPPKKVLALNLGSDVRITITGATSDKALETYYDLPHAAEVILKEFTIE